MSLPIARHLLLSVYFQGELFISGVDAESYSSNTAITVREQVQGNVCIYGQVYSFVLSHPLFSPCFVVKSMLYWGKIHKQGCQLQ